MAGKERWKETYKLTHTEGSVLRGAGCMGMKIQIKYALNFELI
jgi:hypothetical protein